MTIPSNRCFNEFKEITEIWKRGWGNLVAGVLESAELSLFLFGFIFFFFFFRPFYLLPAQPRGDEIVNPPLTLPWRAKFQPPPPLLGKVRNKSPLDHH